MSGLPTPEELFQAYTRWAYQVAWKFARYNAYCRRDMPGTCNASLLGLWRAAHVWEERRRGTGGFACFSAHVCKCAIIDWLHSLHRRRKRKYTITVQDHPVFTLPSHVCSAEQEVEDRDFLEYLLGFVHPEKDRQVMRLMLVDRLNRKDVSVRLGIPYSTIQNVYLRHIKVLQQRARDAIFQNTVPQAYA